jgi:hypothetical protein
MMTNAMTATISRRAVLSRLLVAAAVAPAWTAVLADAVDARPKSASCGPRRCVWRNGKRHCRIVCRADANSSPALEEDVRTPPTSDTDPTGGVAGPVEEVPVLN